MTPPEDREIVELSEFVALRHEARPTNFWTVRTDWWYRVRVHYFPRDGEPEFEFRHRCITDPEIAMRLLKELLVDWIVSIDWSSHLKNYEVALDSKSSNDSHVGVGGSLELAIAQAWKKAVEAK